MPNRLETETLLCALSQMGSYGHAEGQDKETFPRTFYPVSEHMRAFDPSVVLVIGPRGAGKSELFRAVMEMGLLPPISKCLPEIRLASAVLERTEWVVGYPVKTNFPDVLSLTQFLADSRDNPNAAIQLWFAYLIRILWDHLAAEDQEALAPIMQPMGGDATAVYNAFLAAGSLPGLAIDRLDDRLRRDDQYFFVGYDELDTLTAKNWETMGSGIRGLVAFWASYARRWERIRAKIFLRTDLFQRHATVSVADFAKLAANRVELAWSDRNLYAMLLKRIINTSNDLFEYVKLCQKCKLNLQVDSDLGYIPKLVHSEDARPFIEHLIGTYMGANFKKGLAYTWLLNHIRDGRERVLPRPLVRIIEIAAELQSNSSSTPSWPRLLEPKSLRQALDSVSKQHVEYCYDEWPWLRGLATRLRGEHVPWDRRLLERLLQRNWKGSWDEGQSRPPVDSASELVDYLVEIGVFRTRFDGRVDVPDLFLAGLGLKRKGGVRKN